MFRKRNLPNCVGASMRQSGRNGKRSRINPKACSSIRFKALARYWGTEYDWRKVEARLNALPQFITEIDGLDIHFIPEFKLLAFSATVARFRVQSIAFGFCVPACVRVV